jgi:hypothetical protein
VQNFFLPKLKSKKMTDGLDILSQAAEYITSGRRDRDAVIRNFLFAPKIYTLSKPDVNQVKRPNLIVTSVMDANATTDDTKKTKRYRRPNRPLASCEVCNVLFSSFKLLFVHQVAAKHGTPSYVYMGAKKPRKVFPRNATNSGRPSSLVADCAGGDKLIRKTAVPKNHWRKRTDPTKALFATIRPSE